MEISGKFVLSDSCERFREEGTAMKVDVMVNKISILISEMYSKEEF